MPMVLNVVVAEGGAPSETQTPTAAATPTAPVTAAAASLAPAGDDLPQRAAEVPTGFAETPASPVAAAEPVTASEPTVAAPTKSEPISKSGVTVRNTVSPEAFRKMMDEMRSQDPTGKRQHVTAPQQAAATHAPAAATPAAAPEPDGTALDINAKYTFESIVPRDEDLPSPTVDTALLQARPSSEGKLTDEHLRHRAEISGNTIRSRESFCERCANLSSEREAAGA